MSINFTVIGGDMRQAKLCELLSADGHSVCTYALDKINFPDTIKSAGSAAEAMHGAQCIILPLPISAKEGYLNTPLSSSSECLYRIFTAAVPGQIICAGRVDSKVSALAEEHGLNIIDYYAREELMIANAVATAEGAIQLAITETAITLAGAECLVIGYGRIGRMLSHKLQALGACVTVSARKFSDKAWIKAMGYNCVDTGNLESCLGSFDIVINTVPARILGEEKLKCLKTDCLCMDLASKPGGMDFSAASRLGVKAIWALSLPGEVAPVTSGAIIKDTIYNILHEQELKL